MVFLGNPPTPKFDYCISYTDGQPALQMISYVCACLHIYAYVRMYLRMNELFYVRILFLCIIHYALFLYIIAVTYRHTYCTYLRGYLNSNN